MHVAIPLYPRFTALDAVGPYTVMAFAPGYTVTFVAAEPGPVTDDRGTLTLTATASYDDLPRPDVVIVPGGVGTFDALADEALIGWLRQAHEHTRWTTSVCSGALILGAAGLLKGLTATTHWALLDSLKQYGAEPLSERVITQGKIVTAAGVSSGIDMGLTLLAQASDEVTAQTVQLAIEYDPQPPFDCGSPAKAPEGMTDRALHLIV
ncbi:DJ-1/PfpI family protein [Nonomuraea jiangxiensis]|uniref:DJ-1/PfpI family protein n=1 Tax=Nonomuraea jiangxiensis TaxID=633440 RepID=A0A1G8I1E2_9ACTN|nr:DJ-1/PfpI family protein [Nonomuraea jiangxiensis]SDI12718.1 DJ-1/PfpI family protein [Nonomuraea jiangxiensis]